ncbi:hypothetical protein E1180_10065 [Roseibium denhamense]|uniref:Uncharacterized protein n=1 Tax=Roseibium denhamense TaxID=76305 RepID=A0ABY1PKD8_9HYPH|nr:hypothetical protein [Roseibium denhamense]MTI05857.1 hypothetical protein [Roseibium denhamense]SMP35497.1 hypothetical protein SAMN06265374_4033 [Roseibium denhamense]
MFYEKLSQRARLGATASVALVLCLGAFVLQARPAAPDVTIIVSSDRGFVEFFVQGPAELLVDVLGKEFSDLAGSNETIDFASFQDGTWETGDRLFDRVSATLDSQPAEFEAMSLMLHPVGEHVPFSHPVDGQLAISVCNALSREPVADLSALNLFAGFIKTDAAPDANLTLFFPEVGRQAVTLRLITFNDGRQVASEIVNLKDGGKFSVPVSTLAKDI